MKILGFYIFYIRKESLLVFLFNDYLRPASTKEEINILKCRRKVGFIEADACETVY